jgi:hypothetical protein
MKKRSRKFLDAGDDEIREEIQKWRRFDGEAVEMSFVM